MIHYCRATLLLTTAACAAIAEAPATGPHPSGSRVIELTQGFALAGIAYRVTVWEAPRPRGTLRVYSSTANRDGLAVGYACKMQPMDERPDNDQWQCDVPFVHGPPDWRAVVARLDTLGVMNPPTDSAWRARRGQEKLLCLDGSPWQMTVHDTTERILSQDAQVCGPTSPKRARYEAAVEALISSIARQASASK